MEPFHQITSIILLLPSYVYRVAFLKISTSKTALIVCFTADITCKISTKKRVLFCRWDVSLSGRQYEVYAIPIRYRRMGVHVYSSVLDSSVIIKPVFLVYVFACTSKYLRRAANYERTVYECHWGSTHTCLRVVLDVSIYTWSKHDAIPRYPCTYP